LLGDVLGSGLEKCSDFGLRHPNSSTFGAQVKAGASVFRGVENQFAIAHEYPSSFR
jgi:hypothetical protein